MKNNAPPQLTREELASRLAGPNPPLVIDVLPDEEYDAAHLPGAKNACVFKVTFLGDVKRLAPDLSKPVVLYGASHHDLSSTTAAEKLLTAGYTHALVYRGGLEDWRAAGQRIEGNTVAAKKAAAVADGIHQLNLQKSRIEWTGRNLMSTHCGTIKLRAGHIEMGNGRPIKASFTIDMNSMENTDIQDSKMRDLLIAHLKSDDFFDVARFPLAELQANGFTALPNVRPGSPNYEIAAKLTLKGFTADLAFLAMLAPTPDGLLAGDAHFDIDRTCWNVLYGSGKFYEKLGKHLVNDDISLALKLLTS